MTIACSKFKLHHFYCAQPKWSVLLVCTIFPIVFGINLIHFFDGKNKIGLGRIWSFVLGFRSLVARLVPCIWKRGTKKANKVLAMESVHSLRISAPQWWAPWRERREVWREKWKVRIFGKGKCKLIANCANSWQWKCKFIANFSAIMVTSLPSLSLSLSLSLSHVSVSLSLSLSPKSTSRTI